MKKDNNTSLKTGNGSEVVALGLAEQIAKLEAESKKTKEQKAKAAEKAEKVAAAKRKWAEDLAAGKLETASGRVRHNPQVQPETVRPADPGELVNGKPAKGWVVQIRCESCGEVRLINLQDAFQVRRCLKAECRKKASSKSRQAERTAELAKLSPEELQAKLDELKAAQAA